MEINVNNSFVKSSPTNVDQSKLKGDFLKLLMAQMKYSDPLEPPDNLSFTEQLATFAMMEQVAGINSKLDSLMKEKIKDNNMIESVNLFSPYINQIIEAKSDRINIYDGAGTSFYELKDPASKIQVSIMDQGEVLYTKEINNQKAGFHNFEVDASGIKSGRYDFHVTAIDVNGNQVKVGNILENKVDGINVASSIPLLMVGNLNVDPVSVTKIKSSV